ncbi:MAG: adhesin [Methanobrevibacter sp.]|uniref:lectin like domain-containing protein n=1 Tax=Methanobrevibacter sp. TaxID=66852 RepID=UPI0025E65440|nr:lectin like domain-containing protein [Methanobrevibacter sp.]MBQ6099149.1 adhesin [Methanobrevibacter sp.]
MSGTSNKIIELSSGNLTVKNSLFDGGKFKEGVISSRANTIIENTVFSNLISDKATALNFKGSNLAIRNSKFLNLCATLSGGAIMIKFFPQQDESGKYLPGNPFLIENCEFKNVSASNDAGVVFLDSDSGSGGIIKTSNLVNDTFVNCKSRYGGAVISLGGILNVINSTIKNSSASFEGGAIFTSWTNLNIVNSNLLNNSASKNAGAIYFDKGKLTIKQSNITNNKVINNSGKAPNAIYAYEADIDFSNSTFDNSGLSVYADFIGKSKIENINKNEDIFLLNNTNYIVSVENKGIRLNLTKNEISVDKLPSKFNASDWGWITPIKIQGDNFDCWAFATVASLEASILKSTGVQFNLSQNYVQQLQLRYARNDDLRNVLTGFAYSGLGYALSWYGAMLMETPYDDRGIIADTDFTEPRVHVQDAMIIFTGRKDTTELMKKAIMNYGSVIVQEGLSVSDINISWNNYTPEMDHSIHFIALIGWDDNYSESDSNKTGAWLTKDSMSGFSHVFYEDLTAKIDYYPIVPQNASVSYIFDNNIDYHVNYQTDLTGLVGFDGNYTQYSNEFTSKYDELIGAVGTYFNESGIKYSFDVYVNNVKVHSQSGVSEFAGFRTIVLNKYIPIKTGDKFKVVFKNNALPYQAYSRQRYLANMTFISRDGKSWSDFTLLNKTVCLKVYTVADNTKVINNKDIFVDYNGGSYFSVKVVTADGRPVGAGQVVKFTIVGKTYTVKTDSNGIAKLKINLLPKKYTITTTCNGKSVKNTITVKQVLTASKVTVKKTAKKFTLKAVLKINGKLQKGKVIKFTFNGKTYSVKTDAKGIAQKTLDKNVIKKLKKGKTYTFKVTFGKDTIKSTVKVR